jgi:hypothetical protein
METIAFATLLFVVYFCSACCFFYNPKTSATAATSTSVPVVAAAKSTVTPEAQPTAPLPTAIEVAATLTSPSQDEELEGDKREPATAQVEVPIASKEPEQVPLEELARVEDAPFSQSSPTLEELLLGIDLDKLQLRPARKIASRLNIQQKVNGKDQPLGFLRAQIKKRLNEQPQEVAPVISEILRAS